MAQLNPPEEGGVPSHDVARDPVETAAGWIVECSCGWSNEAAPAATADAALDQFGVHQRPRHGD